ncbi:MAG TPA: hypothetical protein VHO70_19760 [Chitinispirillaceae bacterium]|nr:hypothetical protein [Chitinispirillaceae bacterium]
MKQENGRNNYYEDALKIHAICVDVNLSEHDARLLTYMHAKGKESGLGIDYFNDPSVQDAEAIEIMLGHSQGTFRLPSVISLNEDGHKALDLILNISNKINQLDTMLAKELGMENRLGGELKNRLKLYKNREFCQKMITMYKDTIVPKLAFYNKEMVDTAFSRFRHEQVQKEKELLELTGFSS